MTFGRLLVLVFILFYASSLLRMFVRAWLRPTEFLDGTQRSRRLGEYIAPLGWLQERPTTWLWLHRVFVTLGLLIALVAIAGLVLQMMGVIG